MLIFYFSIIEFCYEQLVICLPHGITNVKKSNGNKYVFLLYLKFTFLFIFKVSSLLTCRCSDSLWIEKHVFFPWPEYHKWPVIKILFSCYGRELREARRFESSCQPIFWQVFSGVLFHQANVGMVPILRSWFATSLCSESVFACDRNGSITYKMYLK